MSDDAEKLQSEANKVGNLMKWIKGQKWSHLETMKILAHVLYSGIAFIENEITKEPKND